MKEYYNRIYRFYLSILILCNLYTYDKSVFALIRPFKILNKQRYIATVLYNKPLTEILFGWGDLNIDKNDEMIMKELENINAGLLFLFYFLKIFHSFIHSFILSFSLSFPSLQLINLSSKFSYLLLQSNRSQRHFFENVERIFKSRNIG